MRTLFFKFNSVLILFIFYIYLFFFLVVALKFELVLGLQDDMAQFKPLPTRSVANVPTPKQSDLPDFLRRTIYIPRKEIPILLSKLIIRLNSNNKYPKS
jgi:hypothetical protein